MIQIHSASRKLSQPINSSKSVSLLPVIRDIRTTLEQHKVKQDTKQNQFVKQELDRLNSIAANYGFKLEQEQQTLVC